MRFATNIFPPHLDYYRGRFMQRARIVNSTKLENHREFPMVAVLAADPKTYDKVHGANCPNEF